MNARDELRRDIESSINWASIDSMANTPDFVLADKLIGSPYIAGYRKPRTITTIEELDALPSEVLVLTEQGGYWESIKRHDGKNWWKEPGGQSVSPSEDLTLPATVLHEGEVA